MKKIAIFIIILTVFGVGITSAYAITLQRASFTSSSCAGITAGTLKLSSSLGPNICSVGTKTASDILVHYGLFSVSYTDLYTPLTFHFAEGITGQHRIPRGDIQYFDTYFLCLNNNAETSHAILSFSSANGLIKTIPIDIPAHRRTTYHLNDIIPNNIFATTVTITNAVPILAEMSIYLSSDETGSTWVDCGAVCSDSPRKNHYIADICTQFGYDQFIVLYYPPPTGGGTAENATITQTFYRDSGQTTTNSFPLKPGTRMSIHVNSILQGEAASLTISSTENIVCENVMYRREGTRWITRMAGNTGSPSRSVYFAEGATRNFRTFFSIYNPSSTEIAFVTANMLGKDNVKNIEWIVYPKYKENFYLNTYNPDLFDIGLEFESTEPIVVERTMMWEDAQTGEIIGEARTSGTDILATRAEIPEASTFGFDTYILIINPNSVKAELQINILTGDPDENQILYMDIDAYRRLTVKLNDFIHNEAFSVIIYSLNDVGIVAERAMYILDQDNNVTGGSANKAFQGPPVDQM